MKLKVTGVKELSPHVSLTDVAKYQSNVSQIEVIKHILTHHKIQEKEAYGQREGNA